MVVPTTECIASGNIIGVKRERKIYVYIAPSRKYLIVFNLTPCAALCYILLRVNRFFFMLDSLAARWGWRDGLVQNAPQSIKTNRVLCSREQQRKCSKKNEIKKQI